MPVGLGAELRRDLGFLPLRLARMTTANPKETDMAGTKYNESMTRGYLETCRISEMGRSRFRTVCPFCDAVLIIYEWSLAGSGKKCPGCGSLFTRSGCRPTEKALAMEAGEIARTALR